MHDGPRMLDYVAFYLPGTPSLHNFAIRRGEPDVCSSRTAPDGGKIMGTLRVTAILAQQLCKLNVMSFAGPSSLLCDHLTVTPSGDGHVDGVPDDTLLFVWADFLAQDLSYDSLCYWTQSSPT